MEVVCALVKTARPYPAKQTRVLSMASGRNGQHLASVAKHVAAGGRLEREHVRPPPQHTVGHTVRGYLQMQGAVCLSTVQLTEVGHPGRPILNAVKHVREPTHVPDHALIHPLLSMVQNVLD
eukprot:scpid95383/ scgid4736/ 